MRKSEPKIILNLSVENDELDEKVKIAMDKYVDQLVAKHLEDTITKMVEGRIDRLINGRNWDSDRKIQGMYFSDFVKSKTEAVLTKAIEENAKAILAKKLASLI